MSACSTADGPRVGDPAPDFRLTGWPEGRPTGPPSGEPRVLAFVEAGSFDELPAATLRAIRAQLRGLAAELVVLSSSGVWRLRPDDPVEQLALPGEPLAAEIAVAARHYGVHDGGDAVFVIDGGGVMRFAHRPAQRIQAMFATLETALGIAVETLNARGTLDMVQRVLFTRREWTVTSLVVGCATALFAGCRESRRPPVDNRPVPASERPLEVDITLVINGKRHALSLEPRTSLLDALRERLGLTGTKKGCDAGQCGACTVLVGGKRVVSCLTLAVMAQDKPITTIEGLAKGGELHPMQRAFVEHDGLQCGYCTPGQIMSAVALLDEGRARTDADVREQMSGNICRCGAYPNIVAAIQAARRA